MNRDEERATYCHLINCVQTWLLVTARLVLAERLEEGRHGDGEGRHGEGAM